MLRNGRRSLPDRLLARRAARNAAVAGTPPFAGVAFVVIALCGVLAATTARADDKDIEYVAEHLPEVAMDNRYAALPVWRSSTAGRGAVALGYSRTRSGNLRLAGPMLSASWTWRPDGRWSASAYGFVDWLSFSGEGDLRPLRTVALPAAPLPLPAPARFDGGDGTLRHVGAGVAFASERDGRRLGRHRWVVGLQLERASLQDYRFQWQILAGPAAGTRGQIGFDADYDHITPFAGLEMPHQRGRWTVSPHVLLAVPMPRRGVFTQLSGPGFALAGDTDSAGNGKHFGDASLALGVELADEARGLAIDLGATLAQATLERSVHRGIDGNLMVNVSWRF